MKTPRDVMDLKMFNIDNEDSGARLSMHGTELLSNSTIMTNSKYY